MDRQRFISVPENSKSMEKYYYGIESKEEMIEWILSENEFNSLFNSGIFDQLNSQCELLIDDFESEIIDADKLIIAETAIRNFKSTNNNKDIEHLHHLILEAIKRGTQVSFDF